MENNARDTLSDSTTLSSNSNLSVGFTIIIKETYPNCLFEISKSGTWETNKSSSFHIEDREHHSYLDLFEKLSNSFGLRLPQNRRYNLNKPVCSVGYRDVLTSNIHPDILYGYGDPAVLRVENGGVLTYYMVATSNDAPNSFPILRSKDLINWELVTFVFPEGLKPEWAADGAFVSDYWAPEMHLIGDEFRTYFVARDKETAELCIGLAKSSNPEGPFTALQQPLIRGNVIDPHIFVSDNGKSYLYWKEDNNDVWPGLLIEFLHQNPQFINTLFDTAEDQTTMIFIDTMWPWISSLQPMERFLAIQVLIEAIIADFTSFYTRLQSLALNESESLKTQIQLILENMKTPMYAQELSADGTTLIGERTKIIENNLEWEAHLVEGMWVTQHLDNYYLFYAGNDFSTDQYGIGAAVAKSPMGPFIKMEKPFLQSNTKWWAPGHPSVVKGLDGEHLMFLHAYHPGKAGYKEFRALLSVPLIFNGNEVLPG
ncbi:MAG TPA: glycoside hydrolase family 43 protein [Pedobacter sp.]